MMSRNGNDRSTAAMQFANILCCQESDIHARCGQTGDLRFVEWRSRKLFPYAVMNPLNQVNEAWFVLCKINRGTLVAEMTCACAA